MTTRKAANGRSGYARRYHWYYYPRSYYWQAPPIGGRVPPGGSYSTGRFSAPMARTGSVTRGGFGRTASAHSSAHGSSSASS